MNKSVIKPRYSLSRYLIGLLPLLLVVAIIGAMIMYVTNLNKSKLSYENDGESLIVPQIFSLDNARQDWNKLQNIKQEEQKLIWLKSTLGPTNVGYKFEEVLITGLNQSNQKKGYFTQINCFKVKKLKQYRVILVPINSLSDESPLVMAMQVARQLIAQKHRHVQLSFIFYKQDQELSPAAVDSINENFTLPSSKPIVEHWKESFFGTKLTEKNPSWSQWQAFSKQADNFIAFHSKDLD